MFSQEIADHHINFIRMLKHVTSPWYGKPFQLLPWQEEILTQIYGNVDEEGYRIYQSLFLFIGKKNGKTEMSAAMALDALVNDGEYGAEIYSAATDREQAAIIFRVAAGMVRQSKYLSKILKVVDSQKRIVYHKTGSFYRVLSRESKTAHGINISGLFFDELHAQENRELYDTLTQGTTAARKQPLSVFMTTAGFDKLSVCYEKYDYAKKVRDGIIEDPTFYPAIFEMDEEDDWEDSTKWGKANPSLGHIFDMKNLKKEYKEAKELPSQENSYKRLRLNQWTEQETRWLPVEKWKACKGKIDWAELEGQPCYAAMDLAETTDLTACVLAFPAGEKIVLKPYFWIPEDNISERVKKDKVPYDLWVRQGFIKTTPGEVTDHDFIHYDINEHRVIYDIKEIAYDPWHAQQLVTQLMNDGANMIMVAPTMNNMGPPTKEFEKLVLTQKIVHDGNPVLTWMLSNVAVKESPEGNYKPDKQKSVEKIDGIVASIMAVDRLTRNGTKRSGYEDEGLFIIGD